VDVPVWVWVVTLAGIVGVLGVDLFLGIRSPREVSARQAVPYILFYVGLAVAFAIGLWVVAGPQAAAQFTTGYLLEYSLSVDNLFVYLIVMTRFAVPAEQRSNVLLVGIIGTLVLRGPFIVGGVAAAERFSATFYVFGAILVWTAVGLLRGEDEPKDVAETLAFRAVRRVLPATDAYHGSHLVVRVDGRHRATPLLLVMVAVSVAGLVFALDSIPAIFGVTTDTYIIVTANAFALMGLRQLYFLLHGLLDRLVYLSYGLAIILGFIGVKLILEAAHTEFGEPWPEIGTLASLCVVVGTLAVTTVASLVKVRRDPTSVRETPTARDAGG
jgi:tellurite resistance protein TerC